VGQYQREVDLMKTKLLASILIVLGLGAAASAEVFTGLLNGAQENPPVPTTGTGTGTAIYNPHTDMLAVTMDYSGLIAPTTDAHIHCCSTSLGTNAGVAIGFTGAGGFVTGSTSGNYSHTFDLSLASTYSAGYLAASGGTAALARDRLLDAMRNGVANNMDVAYFNIHTSFRPGGEIRGNIIPGIPEPTTVLLLLMGLAPAAFARRGR
jgi:hypothetical protein